ncbi:unnamed protein product [Caenorhabditis angaria]|uniref:Vitellogenin domain-containing protein n=1 Tax=Caenorhabditis angaria TaxID=860376 RepID=A0A9P1NAR6_9PELO|nr:unnamed protein product [Caenorhabditis angaria]
MKSIILASLLAVAFSASLPAFEHQFDPKSEYHYQFDGLIVSGLPTNQQTQSSQSRISARARIQSIDDRHIHLQLIKIKMASSTEQQAEEKYPQLRSLDQQQEIPEEYQTLLELPVRAQLRNGLVSHIQFDDKDAEWSKNIKRSVLNMLSFVEKQPTQEMESRTENDEQFQSFFTNEKTIEGDCQVAYTITKENEKKTIITKTVNFDKCDSRQQVVYGKQFSENVPQQEQEQLESFKPQTVYTYILDNELLTQVEVRSIYTHNVNGQEVMKTETRSKLTYEENHSINNQIRKVNGEQEEIMYSNKWEKSVEEFFKNGDASKKNPFEEFPTERKMTLLKSILENVEENQNELETVHQLARIVRLLRTCSIEELKSIHKQHFSTEDNKTQSLIEQALAIAGTKNTIQHLMSHLEKQTPARLALLMKYIQETPYPSEKIADILVNVAKETNEPMTKQSAWLAAGVIVRGIVSQNVQQHQLIRQDTRQIKQKYTKVFMNLFEQSETTYEKILALKTLGNAGIDLSVNEINTIINDHRQPMIVRREAVDCLRLLDNVMPLKIQRVLLPIYKNQRYSPELRMSALWRLFQTRPSQPILVQIVSQMEKESNQQVQQFTYQLLKQFAKSTNPQYKQLSSDCLAVLSFTRFTSEQFEQVKSTYVQLPWFARDLLSGVQADFTATFSKDNILPTDLQTSLQSVFGGNWNKYLVQFGFTQQNFEQALVETFKRFGQDYRVRRATRGDRDVEEKLTTLKNLAKKLNLKSRKYQSKEEEAFAMTYLRYKNIDYLVVPFEQAQLENALFSFVMLTNTNPHSFNHKFDLTQSAYFYESIRRVPTTLGLPLVLVGKLPTVASIKGEVKFDTKNVEGLLKVRPSVAATHIYDMKVMTPLFEQGVKSLRSIKSYTPVDVKLNLVPKGKKLEIITKVNVPEKESVSIQVSSRPVVFTRYPGYSRNEYVPTEERTLSNPQWEKKTQNMERSFKILGLEITTRGNVLRQWNLQNVLHIDQDFEIVIRNQQKQTAEFTATLLLSKEESNGTYDFKITNLLEKEFEYLNENNKRREAYENLVKSLSTEYGINKKFVLTLRAPENHQSKIEWEFAIDENVRAAKSEVNVHVTGEQDWTLTQQSVVIIPGFIESVKDHKEKLDREILVNNVVRWGLTKNSKKNEIKLNAQLGQSQSQRKYQQNIEKLSKASQYDRVFQSSPLNQLDIVAEYKCDQQTQQQVERLVDRLNWYLNQFWTASSKQQDNQENRIHMRLTVDPITRQYVNLTLQTPEQQIQLRNIETPRIQLFSFNKMIHQNDKQVCTVSPKRVQTFDEMTYSAPLTTCYSVIAKDCSEQPTFAVLAKKQSKKSNNIVVKFYDNEDVYVMFKSDDELIVKKNGGVMTLRDQTLNHIKNNGEQVQIERKYIRVVFTGEDIKTQVPKFTQNPLCGLCGNNDNEIDNELRTAEDNETEDIEEFHRSYLLRDDECEIEEDIISNKNNYKQIRRNVQENLENYSDSEEYENEENRDEENNLNKKTEIKEFAHRICFSLEGVPACRRQFEEQQTVQQKVKFTCLPRHKSDARVLLNKSRQQNVLELNNYPVSFVESVTVPSQCEYAY